MSGAEKEQYRRFVEHWKRAGPELERIRREELRALDTRKAIAGIDALVDIAIRHGKPRETSGLAERQRWLLEYARRQGLAPPAVAEKSGDYSARPEA
jgi:hypothetical protein